MSFEDHDLYGGLANIHLLVDHFDMGHGITVSQTFAHLMAPFVMAFAPAEPGQPHPAPWRAAKGGFGFDVHAQIRVPKEFSPPNWFDRLNTLWWFVALMRFRASPLVLMPVIASNPFADAITNPDIHFWPVEVEPRQIIVEENVSQNLVESALVWIRDNWWNAGKLMNESSEFNLLFQACDQCVFARNASLALLSLWGSLEGLFSPAKTELRFRVSASMSAYLEPPGKGRLALQKSTAKLYDARSVAAHGNPGVPTGALHDTYALSKRIITKIIETNHVPHREELEAALFGV